MYDRKITPLLNSCSMIELKELTSLLLSSAHKKILLKQIQDVGK